jgi:hypothetical protein
VQLNLPILRAVGRFQDLVEIVPACMFTGASGLGDEGAAPRNLYVTKSTVFQSVKPL